MIRTFTTVFASITLGALIGFGLMYIALSHTRDTVVTYQSPTKCPLSIADTAWGNARP